MARKKKTNKMEGAQRKWEEVWEKIIEAPHKGPSKSKTGVKKFQTKPLGAKTDSGQSGAKAGKKTAMGGWERVAGIGQLLIQMFLFQRLAREIVQNFQSHFCFQQVMIIGLQEATKDYLINQIYFLRTSILRENNVPQVGIEPTSLTIWVSTLTI